jgi:hypothetical protein
MNEENPYQAPITEPTAAVGSIHCPECGTVMETGFVSGRARWHGDQVRGWANLFPKDLLTPPISLSLTDRRVPGHHCNQCKMTIFRSLR